jgi:hypothetical protein
MIDHTEIYVWGYLKRLPVILELIEIIGVFLSSHNYGVVRSIQFMVGLKCTSQSAILLKTKILFVV